MPNLNIFLLFNDNSSVPIAYFRSREAADNVAKYLVDSPVTIYTKVQIEIATLQTAKKAIKDWKIPPASNKLQNDKSWTMWHQNQIRSNRLAKIVNDYLEAQSEFDDKNIRDNV